MGVSSVLNSDYYRQLKGSLADELVWSLEPVPFLRKGPANRTARVSGEDKKPNLLAKWETGKNTTVQ
jgi:hypothetical protein